MGLKALTEKAALEGLLPSIATVPHDLRLPLPFAEETFDACYSHMLFCMAFTTEELTALSEEIRRVLKPGGIHIYTVRHTGDAHYGVGLHHGENLYETNGFIVHFFSREKVAALAGGCDVIGIDEFEEGTLPRKLFRVTLRKQINNNRSLLTR
jgi:SAM-dependent methyltransferase